MTQAQPTTPQLVRIRVYYIILWIYIIFSFYDLYVELRDPYPRLEAEKVATFLLSISALPVDKNRLLRGSTRVSWWLVAQTDCILIGIGLFSYGIHYHVMHQLLSPIT